MQCSLGVFDLNPSYLGMIQALAGLRRDMVERPTTETMRRGLHFLGEAERRSEVAMPDLLQAADGDREWIQAIYDVLVDVSRKRLLTLVECVYDAGPRGYVGFVLQCPEHVFGVRPGEEIVAGLAVLRDREGGLQVWPRTSRLDDGQAVLYVGERRDGTVPTPAEAARWCLSGDVVALAFAQARRSAEQLLIDPGPIVERLGEPNVEADVLRRYRAAGDRSYRGVVGAVAALAAEAGNLRSRLLLESVGGRLALDLCGPAHAAAPHLRSPGARSTDTSGPLTGTFGDVD